MVSESGAGQYFFFERNVWIIYTIEGDSPVNKKKYIIVRAEYVYFCFEYGGPPSIPKPELYFDSERVPWGKGEKTRKEC